MVGYDPALSENAVTVPIFPASTYVFPTAADGELQFARAYHLPRDDGQQPGLIYARLNNPNLEIFETKMAAIEEGAACAAVFPSGMSAITTAILATLGPNSRVLYTDPVYGGTYFFLRFLGERFGITAVPVDTSQIDLVERALSDATEPFDMILIETPANPTLSMTNIRRVTELAKEYCGDKQTLVMVDNTFLGPVFLRPFECGADLVAYSATKFIGGHSDLIAGVILAKDPKLMSLIKDYRTILGGTVSPFTAWLLTRSLATLWPRMLWQAANAEKVARALAADHPKVERVLYPGLLRPEDGEAYETYQQQCTGPGSLISFYLRDDSWDAAQRFLNSLETWHLAVSLGGVESLVEHPRRMTHSDMTSEDLDSCGITDGLIRLSVGTEDPADLISDLEQALDKV